MQSPDTTRSRPGHGITVAVIGSLASARYVEAMRDFIAGPGAATPTDIATTSTHQPGAAIGIAQRLGDAGTSLAEAARTSFMNGWTNSLLIAAAVALIAAATTLVVHPRRVPAHPGVVDGHVAHSVTWRDS